MSKYDYDFAINTLEDKIYRVKSFLRKKMPQKKRDGLKWYIRELRSAIKILKEEEKK